MKFIHAADLHLGNPFVGLANVPAWLQNNLQTASETALARLVDDAIAESVDFVLLAGDLFDTTTPDTRAQLTLVTALQRLDEANIPVVMGFGNHDFVQDWQALPVWPANVTVLPADITTTQLTTTGGEKVAITGFSYTTRHITEDMAIKFPNKLPGVAFHIGMYHGSVGQDGAGDYAPFSLGDLQTHHYDYWALGHIHVRQTLQAEPFVGYSGSLQGLNRNESGTKGYYLVENQGSRLVPEFTPVAPIVWATHDITLTGDLNNAVTQIRRELGTPEEFELVSLTVKTDEPQLLSMIENGQLVATLTRASQSTDAFYVFDVRLDSTPLKETLPAVDQHYWDETADAVFDFETLQRLGLKQVTDASILTSFLSADMMAELKEAVETKLRVAEQGGQTDVD